MLQTVADAGQGIDALADALDAHFEWLSTSGQREKRRLARWSERIREVANRSIDTTVWRVRGGESMLAAATAVDDALSRSPYEIAASIVARTIGGSDGSGPDRRRSRDSDSADTGESDRPQSG